MNERNLAVCSFFISGGISMLGVWIIETDDTVGYSPIGLYINGHRIINATRIEPKTEHVDIPTEIDCTTKYDEHRVVTKGYPQVENADDFKFKFEFTPKTIEEAKKVLGIE